VVLDLRLSTAQSEQGISFGEFLLFFLLLGGALLALAFLLPGSGPALNPGLFWGLTGPSITAFSFALFFLLIAPIYHCAADASIKSFNHWQQSPVTLSWGPGEWSGGLWQQFLQDEFGAQGRSMVKYDWKKWVEMFLYWIFLMIICSGAAALRMAIDRNGIHDVGALPWAVFCVILGGSVGTLAAFLVYVVPEIVLFFRKRNYEEGPQTLLASPEGMYWMGNFINLDPTNKSCCASFATLEHRRLNNYQMRSAPCMEFCFSHVVKNGKNYSFLRIPVPPSKLEEAAAFVNGHFAQPAQNAGVWQEHLTNYAKDLEESSVVQVLN